MPVKQHARQGWCPRAVSGSGQVLGVRDSMGWAGDAGVNPCCAALRCIANLVNGHRLWGRTTSDAVTCISHAAHMTLSLHRQGALTCTLLRSPTRTSVCTVRSWASSRMMICSHICDCELNICAQEAAGLPWEDSLCSTFHER